MSDDYRYLFTVRQQFGRDPVLDCFYEAKIPAGISGSEADMMATLKPGWEEKSIQEDSQTIFGMNLRLRFNSDMYQSVCMVTCASQLDRDMLEALIQVKHHEGTLIEFLDESAIRT